MKGGRGRGGRRETNGVKTREVGKDMSMNIILLCEGIVILIHKGYNFVLPTSDNGGDMEELSVGIPILQLVNFSFCFLEIFLNFEEVSVFGLKLIF